MGVGCVAGTRPADAAAAALAAAAPAFAALADNDDESGQVRRPALVVAAVAPLAAGAASLAMYDAQGGVMEVREDAGAVGAWLAGHTVALRFSGAVSVAGHGGGREAALSQLAGPAAALFVEGPDGAFVPMAGPSPLALGVGPATLGAPARVRVVTRQPPPTSPPPGPVATFSPSPAADAVAADAAASFHPPDQHWASPSGQEVARRAAARGDENGGGGARTTTIFVDALALLPPACSGAGAAELVRTALRRQLMSATTAGRALIFRPPGLAFPVAALMPLPVGGPSAHAVVAAEADSTPARASLAERLRLEGGEAALRLSAVALPPLVGGGSGERAAAAAPPTPPLPASYRPPLLNPHAGLPPPPPPPGSKNWAVHTVAGPLHYHHYGMGGVADAGWGCAYRSGQTLASWCAFQRALQGSGGGGGAPAPAAGAAAPPIPPPPTHAQMQAALVELGDKPPAFLGSTAWIGAAELGFVLDRLAGVACRILPVRDGAEMGGAAVAASLAAHFASQGSPVMVGGGVLAYTCLGVAFEDGGDRLPGSPPPPPAHYLILDPHFPGPPGDAGRVRTGGWVAWRKAGPGARSAGGGTLFEPGAHYNLLCPQRPG